jgi:putative transposase
MSFVQMPTKITVETALNAELDEHLGFGKHEQSDGDNNRNGYTSKTLQTEDGQFELDTPRDRAVASNPSWSKSTSVVLPRWMTISCSFTPRA